MAFSKDFIPVSISGREEDLKIAFHQLVGKVNEFHSSSLGHSHCYAMREGSSVVSVMFLFIGRLTIKV